MLLKKYELTYDTIYKSNNITMNFNEFDVDTSDFVVTVTRKGVQVDLKGSIATIAVIKPNNSVDAQFIDVIDTSKLYCDLKSNMKNLPGTYEAMIMISNNGEHISIGPVKYFVQDNKPFAQLDSSISDDTRLTIVQELLDKLQPIYNTELQRIANEEDRLKAEELRKSLEILRIEAEELRVNNENTRVQSESTRVASENVRIESENFRVANENTREINEATRVASEVSRASSEKIRENSEGDRLEAENTRQANEKNRVLNESQRQQNESDRVVNEAQRVQNESNRQYFEEKRVEAELVRKQWYDKAFEGSEKMSIDEATRVENEAQRVNAETLRIQRESDRVTQETKREQQEVSRTSKENERLQAETTRQSNEGTRQSNESDRVAKESSRVQVEQSRVNAEKLRATNETTRINSEQTRADNEKARVLAEQQRVTEHQAREELLSGYDSRLASIENINETNTIRLNEMDRVNRNQAIAIQGLINEHSDKRISLTEDTHNINLDYATKGILEVDSIEGETLVNVSDQKDSVAISKAYNVEGTNHIALQGEYDGKARPNIHGNTMVNVSSQKDKAPITIKYDDILGKEGKLLVGSVANKKGHVEIDKVVGNTLVNVATQKELVPVTKKYDNITGNEGKLVVGDVANKKGHVEVDRVVGNTLVNLGYKKTDVRGQISDAGTLTLYFYATSDDTQRFYSRMKPSTTYTVVLLNKPSCIDSCYLLGKAVPLIDGNKALIITPQTLIKMPVHFYGIKNGATLEEFQDMDFIILEGDYTNKPIPNEVFEGLQSSFEENLVTQEMVQEGIEDAENLGKYKVPIKLVGKNKFDGKLELGNYDIVNGTPINQLDYLRSVNIIPVRPNTIYIATNSLGVKIARRYYDINGNFIYGDSASTGYFTTPTNCYYMHIVLVTTDTTVQVQFEEGTIATDYEEYFERTANAYLNSPLLEGDEIVMHDGELCHYHKCDEEVFDGSDDETWNPNTPTETHYNWYSEDIQGKAKSSGNLICDKLPLGSASSNSVTGIRLGSTRNVTIVLPIDEVTDGNTTSIKQWLQSNPISVVYELAEPYYEPISSDKLLLECANDSTIHLESVVPVENISFKSYEEELNYLYTSKVYTVQFNSDNTGTCDINLGGAELLNQSVKKGLNKFNITTLSTLVDNKLIINGEGFNVEEVAVVDTESNFGYFEGLESSFEGNLVTQDMVTQGLEDAENLGKYKVPIKIVGKNKLDMSKATLGYITSIGQIVTNVSSNFKSDFIKISPNTNYIAKMHNGNWVVHGNYSWFDSNKVFIRRDTTNTYITSPSNAEYLIYHRATLNNVNIDDLLSIQCQIEEGAVATDYEEYFERTTNVYLNSPLLEGDEIVMKNGELCHYHKYYEDVFDGSDDESWKRTYIMTDSNYCPYNLTLQVKGKEQYLTKGICDKFIWGGTWSDRKHIWLNEYNVLVVHIERTIADDDIVSFKAWLQSNPIKIIYELAEPYYEVIQSDTLLLECANDSTIYLDTVVPVESVSFKAYEEELKYLYTSKDYKVKFTSDAIGTCDITLGGTKLVSQSIKVGINEFSITTPATLTDNKLVIEGEGFNIEKVSVVDTTLDFDYFEGMYSCFENQLVTDEADPNFGKYKVDYKVTGKNKLSSKMIKGYYYKQAYKPSEYSICSEDYIKVKPNTNYIISIEGYNYLIYTEMFDSNLNVLTEINRNEFITPNNCEYIRFGTHHSATYNLDTNVNVQIEEGTKATEFEEYREYIKTFYLNSPLLKGDTIEEINGKTTHVHRYKQEVFDGSEDEDWEVNNEKANTINFYMPYGNVANTEAPLMDKFKVIQNYTIDEEGTFYANTNMFYVSISKSKLSYVNVMGLKSWLKANPIKVVYRLATPVYETISEDNRIIDSYVNGHLDLDSNVPVKKVDFRAWEGKLKYLYLSTTYTVQFVSDIDTKVNITLGGSLLSSQLATKGLNKFTIQTPATIDANEVRVDGIGANISKVLVTNSTREFNYFEGLKSSFEDNVTEEGKYKVPVKIVGKNKWSFGDVLQIGTKSIDLNKPLKAGTYTISSSIETIYTEHPVITFLNGTDVVGYQYLNQNRSVTLKKDINKVILYSCGYNYNASKDKLIDFTNIQIEEGTVATSYEKYYEYNASVLLNSPLLKGDELVMKDGELCHYHKCGKGILDGSEVWTNKASTSGSYNYFYLSANTLRDWNMQSQTRFIVDKIPYYSSLTYSDFAIKSGSSEAIQLRFDSVSSVANLKIWLQSNPVTLVYELAEPWYEPIQIGKIMLECINNSIFTIDTDLPVKSSINYSASIPSVQAMSNDINSLQDTSVDIITSSWDTDYRLSEVEWILEDNGLLSPMMFNLETKSTRGGTSMAFTKFEQAKIMILAGAYDREVLTKQLQRYLEKGVITKTEYEDLIALMDANELVAGK